MAERGRWRLPAALVLLSAALASPAQAQLTSCALPETIPVPRHSGPSEAQPRRVVPVGSYTLALSWSPQYCAGRQGEGSFQCGGRDNRFGFILHGLWPDGAGADWPQYCRPAQRLPAAVLRANLCATPSADLLQHEWAKHGTCMSRTPQAYFERARALYGALRFPDMEALARRGDLTRGTFVRAFLAANARAVPGLKENALRVRLTRQGWLDEVRVCLDRQFRSTACPRHAGGPGSPGQRLRIRMQP